MCRQWWPHFRETKRIRSQNLCELTVQREDLGVVEVWFLRFWNCYLFWEVFSSLSRFQPVCAILGFVFLSLICKMHFQLHNNCSTCVTYLYLEISRRKPKFIALATKAATPGDLCVLINGMSSLWLIQNEISETSLTLSYFHLIS